MNNQINLQLTMQQARSLRRCLRPVMDFYMARIKFHKDSPLYAAGVIAAKAWEGMKLEAEELAMRLDKLLEEQNGG